MGSEVLIDASQIKCWLECREKFRRRYVENVVPSKPMIHLEYGTAIHKMHEAFWNGMPYPIAYKMADDHLKAVDQTLLTVKERNRLVDLWDGLPDMVGTYYDNNCQDDKPDLLEHEWVFEFMPGVSLCGKLDWYRTLVATLRDLKTASEIGRQWKKDFTSAALRDVQLPLYDWYLRRAGYTVERMFLEVLIKPYKDKPCRYELLELRELLAYRGRFEQQLKWVVSEIAHYLRTYSAVKPWPMSSSMCLTKYGECDYLRLCNEGDSQKNLKMYKPREEHLLVRLGQAVPAQQ